MKNSNLDSVFEMIRNRGDGDTVAFFDRSNCEVDDVFARVPEGERPLKLSAKKRTIQQHQSLGLDFPSTAVIFHAPSE